MYSSTPPSRPHKRPNEESSTGRPRKIPDGSIMKDCDINSKRTYKFRILLPNGRTLEHKMSERMKEVPIEEFAAAVKKEYVAAVNEKLIAEPERKIEWTHNDLHFSDANGNKIKLALNLDRFVPQEQWHFLKLHDGSLEPDAYDDMWDLTPDTELLKELPDEYTFVTAIADLIDNSLQAVWNNRSAERRLVSVELNRDSISIFDTGPGMDGRDGKIVKWGKMGASLHRASRERAVGGEPPYLMPFFGMFGYGGPVATMHLGRCACVSSKTKSCDSVYTLQLEKDALVNSSQRENSWRTRGSVRGPSQVEREKSPHGSFTDVQISGLKMRSPDVKLLRFTLKDIYFPYIQCDDMSGKTSKPIEFEVNGIDLAEIVGGEVATTNLHSCNGPEFVLQLHFSLSQDSSSATDRKSNVVLEANARLKCVYFPIIKGEESIERIINKLKKDGFAITETYQSFSRVSIRRLGRLLPDARWPWLPFMEPKLRKGLTAETLRRCCYRVKCFVDTDSGFNPTPSKTDLAHHHPYTSALKNFGNTLLEDKEVQIEIHRDGKKLTLSQVEKQYHDWIGEMHERYDDEIYSDIGDHTLVFLTSKDKKLAINSDVVRVYKEIKWKANTWKAGQKIKILKGACAGVHKQNVFAILEHILLEGLQEDTCGEARLICRPLGVPEDKGCSISTDKIEIRESISVPINVIDTGKLTAINDEDWKNRYEMYDQKQPSSIDILSDTCCKELEIEGGLLPNEVDAGDVPPENIVAVVRPKAFRSASNSNMLEQKFIVRNNLEMSLEVNVQANAGKSRHIYSVRIKPTMSKAFHGIYIFPLRMKIPRFEKAGCYIFSLSLLTPNGSVRSKGDVCFKQVVRVKAMVDRCRWRVVDDNNGELRFRVGSPFAGFSVECYDQFDNNVPFESAPKLKISLILKDNVIGEAHGLKAALTNAKSIMMIKDFSVTSNKLDKLRPNYEATLKISTPDEAFSVNYPCQVMPGSPAKIIPHPRGPQLLKKKLVPGQIVDELRLEVFDAFGNHVKEDEVIYFLVDGFAVDDGAQEVRKSGSYYTIKADATGFIDLSNLLKVSGRYGEDVSLHVVSEKKGIFDLVFRIEVRELRTVTKVFEQCEAGSQLENVVFEITNSEGSVDETISDDEKCGQRHSLKLTSDSFAIDDSVRYNFRHGRCTIRALPLPQSEGIFSFKASHSRYPELNVDIEVHVENIRRGNNDDVLEPDSVPFTCGNLSPRSPVSRVPLADHEFYTPQSSNRDIPPFDYTPIRATPIKEYHNGVMPGSQGLDWTDFTNSSRSPQSSMKEIKPFDYSPSQSTPRPVPNKVQYVSDSHDLDDWWPGCYSNSPKDDLAYYGSKVNDRRSSIKVLEDRKLEVEKTISHLQVSAGGDYVSHAFERAYVRKKIEASASAAAVVCKSLSELSIEERPRDILGVVALLGSAQSIELSRMISKFLGEEQMLAVVCTNFAAVETLESSTLKEFASKFGVSVPALHALCLQDLRPFTRTPRSDRAGTLPIRNPTLPDGTRPKGFLGFAVNMITVETIGTDWKTNSGHGLRETLFYSLLGELQVYQDWDSMKMARSCITGSAISLDGVIMRGNGLISLGTCEPDIHFPVTNMNPLAMYPFQTAEQIRESQRELTFLSNRLDRENKLLQEDLEKFERSRLRYISSQEQRSP